jgi:hypothetical protein
LTAAISSTGHSVDVQATQTVGVPTATSAWTAFDEHGLSLALKRLRGERNEDYRRRLFDVFANRANSAYRGLINGMTRELNLEQFEALTVNPKLDTDGSLLAPDPYIKFNGAYLYLYSDYANDELDYKIDRYEPGGNYEDLGRLVAYINTSAYFEAGQAAGVDPYTLSMCVFNQSNRSEVDFESVPASTRFRLYNKFIVPNSVFFTNRTVFKSEVASVAAITSAGDYYIDYATGIVTCYTIPVLGEGVRYQYTVYPFRPKASPVIIAPVAGEDFKSKMFSQELQDDGTYVNGVPSALGIDIINEIMATYPLYYGV